MTETNAASEAGNSGGVTAPAQRRRRRPVPKDKRCQRHGCTRRSTNGYEHCSRLCFLVAEKVDAAEQL